MLSLICLIIKKTNKEKVNKHKLMPEAWTMHRSIMSESHLVCFWLD